MSMIVQTKAPRHTLIRAARLIDGRGGPPIEQAAMLLEGNRIRQVGRAADVAVPAGAPGRVLDYPAGSILPGLVDAHTHLNGFGDARGGDDLVQLPEDTLLLQAAQNARRHLESGVTTLRDCGSKGTTSFALRRAAQYGVLQTPRLVLCGRPITITGGHLWYFGSEADGTDAVRRMVRQLIKEGADFIKIVATGGSTRSSNANLPAFSVEELCAIVDEAHRFGKPTAAHCSSTQGIINALEAGVDTVIHCVFREPDGSARYRPEVTETLVRQGAWVDATLAQSWMRVLELEVVQRSGQTLTETEQAELQRWRDAQTVRREHVQHLLQAGVKMVSGSDSSWSFYPMGKFQYEVIIHAEWGMGNLPAITAGTRDAAICLGVGDVTGSLEPGKAADVLVVDGNPAENIWDLLRVRDVFLGGERVVRSVAT